MIYDSRGVDVTRTKIEIEIKLVASKKGYLYRSESPDGNRSQFNSGRGSRFRLGKRIEQGSRLIRKGLPVPCSIQARLMASSSAAERLPVKQMVDGSIPSLPVY